jgi:hypothetical protein
MVLGPRSANETLRTNHQPWFSLLQRRTTDIIFYAVEPPRYNVIVSIVPIRTHPGPPARHDPGRWRKAREEITVGLLQPPSFLLFEAQRHIHIILGILLFRSKICPVDSDPPIYMAAERTVLDFVVKQPDRLVSLRRQEAGDKATRHYSPSPIRGNVLAGGVAQ